MSLENGVSDDLRSGFRLTHTTSVEDGTGHIRGGFTTLLDAPDYDGEHAGTAEVFMTWGIVRFFEKATNGSLKMVLIFSKALWNLRHEQP